ncbi:FAD-dependent oxidoreductase [Rhodococcus xishaensis]|uniref:NAD(P)/FAD-dependent oxidoreductase n=1 Tax=Rhodococcus xishaensis TaxID=2487364 RepID=A0A3S3AD93_9NOCA|nr:FAD-dependent oxidoreductase [Rhodococcus xishaensis]RVW05294.1 NAD(P)/FAD-dependent oxidoreductase [Rhodococcus xishaensis]
MSTRVVIVGNGMAGARLAEELRRRERDSERVEIVVLGAEPRAAYNRILLSNVLAGSITARDIRLRPDDWWARNDVDVRVGVRATEIDVDARIVRCDDGTALGYDEIVLATGSTPFVPPIDGMAADDERVVTFRTVEDCDRIADTAGPGCRAVVLGGGLLGLEAARGLLLRGADVTVVHPNDVPMERQMDEGGGRVLSGVLSGLGVRLLLQRRAVSLRQGDTGRELVLDDGSTLPADLVVLTAGVRPETDLARGAGVVVDHGIVVDDALRTSAPNVWAIGECAQHRGEVYGLVQPGWDQAAVVADRIIGADPDAEYVGTPPVTRLKAHDIDLASMGDVTADLYSADPQDDREVLVVADPARGRYAKLVVSGERIVGAVLLGTPDVVGTITQLFDAELPVPQDRMALLTGRGSASAESASPAGMPGSAVICRCNSVTKANLTTAWRAGARSVPALATATRATTGCGGCSSAVEGICEWLRTADPSSEADADNTDNTRPAQKEGAA